VVTPAIPIDKDMNKFTTETFPISITPIQINGRLRQLWVFQDRETETKWREVKNIHGCSIVIYDRYSKRRTGDNFPRPPSPRPEDLIEDGWTYDGRETTLNWLGEYRDCGLLSIFDESDIDVSNGACEIVICDWPETEDETRLAPIWKEIEKSLDYKLKLQKQRQEKNKSTPQEPIPVEC